MWWADISPIPLLSSVRKSYRRRQYVPFLRPPFFCLSKWCPKRSTKWLIMRQSFDEPKLFSWGGGLVEISLTSCHTSHVAHVLHGTCAPYMHCTCAGRSSGMLRGLLGTDRRSSVLLSPFPPTSIRSVMYYFDVLHALLQWLRGSWNLYENNIFCMKIRYWK